MSRTILVPLDGSPFGEQAVAPAAAIARRIDARLRLVHVHPPIALLPYAGASPVDPDWERRARAQERDYLESVARRARAWTDGAVETAVLEGHPAVMLDQDARDTGAELIVMTTHGHGGLRRAWLGSVADGLIRRARQPLLLIRPRDDTSSADAATSFRRILIPLDGSGLAERVLPSAVMLGDLYGAEYLLLRVIVPVPPIGGGGAIPGLPGGPDVLERERAAAREYLDDVAARLRTPDRAVRTLVVDHTQPAVAIHEQADEYGADLIAMATHGRGGLTRLLIGSVADKVLRGTTRPLLVLRPEDGEERRGSDGGSPQTLVGP